MSGRTLSRARATERLGDRRRRGRRRLYVALAVLVCILVGFLVWGLWQSAVRISQVSVVNGGQSLATYATDAMHGRYLGFLPGNSTFFVPESAMRRAILAAHPEFAAVSIYHTGFNSIAIKADIRTAVARWCGLSPTPGVPEYCYLFDPNGYVYEALPEELASSTPLVAASVTLNTFKVYAPLVGDAQEPLRATLTQADELPAAFDFARQLSALGATVTSIVIHDGEIDDLLTSGTRVMYVLGKESDAFTALKSAGTQVNLADGSLEYLDLRFPGKIYLKKKMATP